MAELLVPRSPTARAWAAEALTAITVRTSRVRRPGRPAVTTLDFQAQLLVYGDAGPFYIPVTGTLTTGATRRSPQRLAAAVTGLRDGVPLQDSLGQDWPRWLPPQLSPR